MAAVTLLVSAALAFLIAPGALRAFAEHGFTRPNYRGAELPFPAGAIAVCAGILALGLLAVAEAAFDWEILEPQIGFLVLAPFDAVPPFGASPYENPIPWLVLWLGVALLGLLDDMLDAAPRGWRGHARAVLGGGFDTGALKALGTAALAFTLLAPGRSLGEAALSTVVIALATNLFNLLDLRPGRAAKVWVLLTLGLLIGEGTAEHYRLVGVMAGPLLVLSLYDLRERCMLGDTGSNVLGALAGTCLVVSLGTTGEGIAAAVLLAVTIFGEFRSISASIDRVPPLRALDSLGRRSDA